LRIEDTDRSRFVPGATEKIYEVLKKFGLFWDEGPQVSGPYSPYIQSERVKVGVYKKYADKLLAENHAYFCFCPAQTRQQIRKEQGQGIIKSRDSCRNISNEEVKKRIISGEKPGVRLRVPDDEEISFTDFVIKKEISWQTKFVDEVMLLKSDGFPTYHLAAIVDDYEMKITHVIRGRDWLPSVPVHLLLMRYLGFPRPEICHLTDILDPSGGKLSKRKGSVSCEEFLAEGFLPEAILNFIMLLGWAPKDNREIFSLEEFVQNFQKGDLQIANPIFNRAKLEWFNSYYIRKTQNSKLKTQIFQHYKGKFSENLISKIVPLIKDRIVKLSDFESLAGFLIERPKVETSLFGDLPYKEHLKEAIEVLATIEQWNNETIQQVLSELITKKGWKTGDFYMSFRIALAGSRFTPPITESAEILGKEETLTRLKRLL